MNVDNLYSIGSCCFIFKQNLAFEVLEYSAKRNTDNQLLDYNDVCQDVLAV